MAEQHHHHRKLLNDPANVVDEMLQGIARTHPQVTVNREYRLILDAEFEKRKQEQVVLLSGGGSGHEPAHGGLVGHGMLTAAVCGDVFASPSMHQVLVAIRLITGPAGCLVIVKNYTGDRINFGLAVEQARSEGLKVEMIVVGEDTALRPSHGVTGKRGLCGTVLVHKIAGGAAAFSKASLDETLQIAQSVARNIGTIGIALKSCTLPGKSEEERIKTGDMELGLGIHGEPGVRASKLGKADAVVETMVETILDVSNAGLQVEKSDRVVVIVNNLGGTTLMELYVVARKAVEVLETKYGLQVVRILVGAYMTALDMVGCSVTVFRTTDVANAVDLLDKPVQAPGWPVTVPSNDHDDFLVVGNDILREEPNSKCTTKCPDEISGVSLIFEKAILSATNAVVEAEPQLTEWDTLVGDGDCGNTLKTGALAVKQALSDRIIPVHESVHVLHSVGHVLRHSIGGTSGVLYDIFFMAAGNKLLESSSATPEIQEWVGAFEAGVSAIQRYGGATEGCRTMLDAMLPAIRAAKEASAAAQMSALSVLKAAAEAAEKGANSTSEISASVAAGRTGYVSAASAKGVPDPGAKAVAIWLQGIVDSLQ